MVKRKGLPEQGELVICTVEKVTQNAAWCTLDEYHNAEGMIHITEASGRWIYNIKDAVKIGKQYVVKAMNIDPETKHVNLSLKRVSRNDEKRKLNQYNRERRAENILNQVAKNMKKTLEDAYQEVGYLLQENFGELSTAFDEMTDDPHVLDKFEIKKEWRDALAEIINKIFISKTIMLKAELDLRSYSSDGIDFIKNLLSQLQQKGYRVKYISAPKYIVEITTNDPKKAEREMVIEMETIEKLMKSKNGEASYKLVR